MPKTSTESVVGRQTQLPLGRALEISIKSLKSRFWRSMITASGIFLGIAFLSTVVTQNLMQWPLPEKVDAGFVRIGGEINGPGDYEAWRRIPVAEGVAAGLPEDVVDKASGEDGMFSLGTVVQGKLDAIRADKNVVRVQKEWVGLKKLQDPVQFWVDVKDDKDIAPEAAIAHGVPSSIVKQLLVDDAETFKGSWLADVIREQPTWISPFHAAIALDQDITLNDGVKNGVPEAIARHLIGEGKSFKGGGLNDAIIAHPTWLKIWDARQKRYSVYKKADDRAIVQLGDKHAYTLGEILEQAEKPTNKAHVANVMVVNEGGRRLKANFSNQPKEAGGIEMKSGDTILVPDIDSHNRMIWLVVMSLLVCTVGITNSMLMSVTERFKEIGTYKCLGALDKFVVTLFMLESGMMGIAASVMGWLVGFLVMVLLAGVTRGWDIVGNIGFADVLRVFLYSVGTGLLLTIVATIAPAQRAAKMPAAMALRSEI